MQKKLPFKRFSKTESAIFLILWLTWIVVINEGTQNGIGYFQQPENDLLWPLINGSIFNALVFFICVVYLMPRFLNNNKYQLFSIYLVVLMLGYLFFKTLAELLIIYLGMPELSHVSLYELMLENFYVFFAFLIMGTLYSIIRDWLKEVFSEFEDGYIKIKVSNQTHRIKIDDILYIKSEGNYVLFVLEDKQIITYMSMKQVNLILSNKGFIQIHRSYIVAVAHIDVIGKKHIILNNKNLPIGGTFKNNLNFFTNKSGFL